MNLKHSRGQALGLHQRFPACFHLRTPWQPIAINCTPHISKILVINIVNYFHKFLLVYCLTLLTYESFPRLFNFFVYPHMSWFVPLEVRIPQVWNHCLTHTHTHTYTYIHTDTHTHTHTYMHTYIHSTYIRTYVHNTYIHIYKHTHIHSIYIRTYIHTYICTYVCTNYVEQFRKRKLKC
jgi:hypothetical protein